jgi:hypothetical protein
MAQYACHLFPRRGIFGGEKNNKTGIRHLQAGESCGGRDYERNVCIGNTSTKSIVTHSKLVHCAKIGNVMMGRRLGEEGKAARVYSLPQTPIDP